MKIIHQGGFTPAEVEYYRRQVFDNLCTAMRLILDAMDEWMLDVSEENRVRPRALKRTHCSLSLTMDATQPLLPLFVDVNPLLQEGEQFPLQYKEALTSLWEDASVRSAVSRSNEAPIPEKSVL